MKKSVGKLKKKSKPVLRIRIRFYHQAKFLLFCYILSLKNDVNVALKSNQQKNAGKKLFSVASLKVTGEN
jgi:hypothetical protein